jgi:glutaredoxin/glutathione-dependent peroxiredoxin
MISSRSRSVFSTIFTYKRTIVSGSVAPSGLVDVVEVVDGEWTVHNAQNFGDLLKESKRSVLFAVPGAFTPTCSEKHLPGFVEKAEELRKKGIDNIYCLAVNDFFVMKAWANATKGLKESGIKLIADGNGDYTKAMQMELDLTGGRLGMRCKRFAAVVEQGIFTTVNTDTKVLDKSSAESVLSIL